MARKKDTKTIHEALEAEIAKKESALKEARSDQTRAFIGADIEDMSILSGDLFDGAVTAEYVINRCRSEFGIDLVNGS